MPAPSGVDHQRVQHHDLVFRHVRIAPVGVSVFRYLHLIDARRRADNTVCLHDKKVVCCQRSTRRLFGRIYPAQPADRYLPGFLLQKNPVINTGNRRNICLHRFSDCVLHISTSCFKKTGLPNTTRFSESVYQISSPAKDFRSEQGGRAKAYRVYVEPDQRGSGRKDPAEIILCQRFCRPRRPDPGQYSRAR